MQAKKSERRERRQESFSLQIALRLFISATMKTGSNPHVYLYVCMDLSSRQLKRQWTDDCNNADERRKTQDANKCKYVCMK